MPKILDKKLITPAERTTEINGIKIPAPHGSCRHGILCALALNKEKLCRWDRIYELTEKYIRQYGGHELWDKFENKRGKTVEQRIKDSVCALIFADKDNHDIHKQGIGVYVFKDGAVLFIGGEYKKSGSKYTVNFPDGKKLQSEYCVTTHREFVGF